MEGCWTWHVDETKMMLTYLFLLVYCVPRVTLLVQHAWESACVVLVGNKIDQKHLRRVSKRRGQKLADELGSGRQPSAVLVVELVGGCVCVCVCSLRIFLF